MLSAAFMLLTTSCSTSDNSSTTSDYVGITAATFGTLRKQSTTGTSYSTYTPSSATYPIYIDNINKLIYNPDSLPVRTIPSKVLLTLSFKNNSFGILESVEKQDSFPQYYYSTDTLDFTKKRKIRVCSSDGEHTVDYTIDVRIHKVSADSIEWTNIGVCNNIKNKKLITLKPLSTNSSLYLLAADTTVDASNNIYYSMQLLKTTDGNTWSIEYSTPSTILTTTFDLFKRPSIAVYNNKVYLLNNGELRCSDDWSTFTPCSLRAILGGYDNSFFGVSDTKKIQITTGDPMSSSFSDDDMEDLSTYAAGDSLPYTDYNLITTTLLTDASVGRAILVANKQNDDNTIQSPDLDKAVIWGKIIDNSLPQKWIFINPAWNNHSKVLPRMKYLSATSYANGIVAIGGNPTTKKLYYSSDWGTTWTTNSKITVPSGFQGTEQAAIATDENYIYLIGGGTGEVWKGQKLK